jgi:hypothetical protein
MAHHADQLRRVVPDGTEDLGYASAFEIGRLLALAQPGVVAALARWRRDGYAAACTTTIVTGAVAGAPGDLLELADRPDLLASPEDATRAGSLGARLGRALVETLGQDADRAPAVPVAPPSGVAAAIEAALPDRDDGLLRGLGLSGVDTVGTAEGLLAATADRPVVTADANPRDLAARLRTAVESEAMRTATASREVLQ